jgi:hypothetical protein
MQFSFKLSVTNDTRTGEILAVYLRVRKGKVEKVRELEGGAAFANYGRKGELLGIEILAPCHLSVLDKLSQSDLPTKTFIRKNMPPGMVLAGTRKSSRAKALAVS